MSVGKFEGMRPRTLKWIPTLEVKILMDFQIFRDHLEGSKFIRLKTYLYHWKILKTWMFEMGSHYPFEYFQHKLWPKE
jgi:hypothetical protein